MHGIKVTGIRIGIGKGKNLAAHICQRTGLLIGAGHDQIGLVKRLALIERHGHQPQVILVAHIGVAAQPGEIKFLIMQHIDDRVITAALNENDGSAQAVLKVKTPFVVESRLMIQKHRGQVRCESASGGLFLPPATQLRKTRPATAGGESDCSEYFSESSSRAVGWVSAGTAGVAMSRAPDPWSAAAHDFHMPSMPISFSKMWRL